jgi:hypothetical protein
MADCAIIYAAHLSPPTHKWPSVLFVGISLSLLGDFIWLFCVCVQYWIFGFLTTGD